MSPSCVVATERIWSVWPTKEPIDQCSGRAAADDLLALGHKRECRVHESAGRIASDNGSHRSLFPDLERIVTSLGALCGACGEGRVGI